MRVLCIQSASMTGFKVVEGEVYEPMDPSLDTNDGERLEETHYLLEKRSSVNFWALKSLFIPLSDMDETTYADKIVEQITEHMLVPINTH
jgi:hypothetical protein